VIGGLIVGMSKSMIVMVFPRAEDIIPYVIMAFILIFRQRGLMGEKSVLEV
jgi:branched-subunit amino acid ABC-type transport system permease component